MTFETMYIYFCDREKYIDRGYLKMVLLKKLSYPSYEHKENTDGSGCYGRVVTLYVFVKRKWVKIGEYCKKCGEVGLLPEYEKGFVKL